MNENMFETTSIKTVRGNLTWETRIYIVLKVAKAFDGFRDSIIIAQVDATVVGYDKILW